VHDEQEGRTKHEEGGILDLRASRHPSLDMKTSAKIAQCACGPT
jgi:hypothetical protein